MKIEPQKSFGEDCQPNADYQCKHISGLVCTETCRYENWF